MFCGKPCTKKNRKYLITELVSEFLVQQKRYLCVLYKGFGIVIVSKDGFDFHEVGIMIAGTA